MNTTVLTAPATKLTHNTSRNKAWQLSLLQSLLFYPLVKGPLVQNHSSTVYA
jgi:hypothetical protein